MKRILLAGLALIAAPAAAAAANETTNACRDYVAANGGDASGCDCLGEKAATDAALADALARIKAPADLEAADQSTKDAIVACFPQ
jgi:hypothetical protein